MPGRTKHCRTLLALVAAGCSHGQMQSTTPDDAAAGGAGGSSAGLDAGTLPRDTGGSTAPDVVTVAPDTRSTEEAGPPPPDLAIADPDRLIWPNEVSSKNSDPWLVENHTKIVEMHPRFLIIDFANNFTDAQVMARFKLHKDALMEGSRYHGYSNPDAKPFMIWEVFKHVSLKDNPVPPGAASPNSSKMPRLNGGIDFGQLFTQAYADLYKIPDPANPGRFMKICDLFNAGMVNDILVAFEKKAPDNNVPEVVELHQVYDASEVKVPNRFDPSAGNGSWGTPEVVQQVALCGRSVRLNFLEMTGNLTNAMEVLGHNFEHIAARTMPKFFAMLKPFLNFDMRTRYGTMFNDWYGICQYGAPCLTFPSNNSVTYPGGMTISPFDQGCGNAHFPPNATRHYDKANAGEVLSTCEHYGLHDGPGGKDLQTPYSFKTLDRWKDNPVARAMPGGAWFLYWWQSWPGYGNKATMPDGSPMKNWWVYLYY
jgi:hypothetical protein